MNATQLIPNKFYKFTTPQYKTTYMFQFDRLEDDYVYSANGVVDNSENEFLYFTDTSICNTKQNFIEMNQEEIDYFNKLKKQFEER